MESQHMDWENKFDETILDRGYDYFQRGLVSNIKKSGNIIKADVSGSSIYRVSMKIKDGQPISASCDCSYASGNRLCKHMAAVYFAVNDEKVATESESDNQNVENIVEEVSDKDIREFVIETLKLDSTLFNLFKIRYSKMSKDEFASLKSNINNIFNAYKDRYGYIDYYNAGGFENDLEIFINETVQSLVDSGQLEIAYKLINYIAVKISKLNIDDSDGEIIELMECCDDIWTQIISLTADMKLKRKMFKWFQTKIDKLEPFDDTIDNILFSEFNEQEFLEKKLTWTKQRFVELKDNHDSYTDEYRAKSMALHYVDMLKKLNYPTDMIRDFLFENSDDWDIRRSYVTYCIEHEDYSEAIRSLIEGKRLFSDLSGIVNQFSIQLKDLYKKIGYDEDYRNELWELLTKTSSPDIKLYRELKSVFTDKKWPSVREKLLADMPKGSDLQEIYLEDKLLDKLLESVLSERGLYGVQRYGSTLRPLYSAKLLQKYVQVASDMATDSGTRQHYRKIVKVLKEMLNYPGGNAAAEKLIEKWREEYKMRPAMMDELNKF